jgi:mono/diheme cytochrome c family protein
MAANRKNPREGKRMTMTRILIGLALSAAHTYSPPAAAQALDGQALFAKNCAACHQASGKGIPGAFPALAANPFVQGPASEVATVLLKGRGGMPDFSASLGDEAIAQVLSYARGSWGNKAAPVQADEVAALRATLQVAKAQDSKRANKH